MTAIFCSNVPRTPPPTSSEAASFSVQFDHEILRTSSKTSLSPHSVRFKTTPPNKWLNKVFKIPGIKIELPKLPEQIYKPGSANSEASCCDYDSDSSSSSSFTTYATPQSIRMNTPQSALSGNSTRSKETVISAQDQLNDSTDYCFTETDDESGKDCGAEYPWPVSSDDSFAHLSEHEVLEKIKERLYRNCKKVDVVSEEEDVESENEKENKENDTETVENEQKNKRISEKIDPLWIDPQTGKFISFIVKSDSNVSDEYAMNYISDYEEEQQYDGDKELEDEYEIFHDFLQRFTALTPVQSCTDEADFEFDCAGCDVYDID